jgi:hypothetical protein
LRLQAGIVLGQRLLDQAPLVGSHRLGLGAELPRLQPRQLEGHLLKLGILVLDLPVARVELRAHRADAIEQQCCDLRCRLDIQPLQVFGLEMVDVEHGPRLCGPIRDQAIDGNVSLPIGRSLHARDRLRLLQALPR